MTMNTIMAATTRQTEASPSTVVHSRGLVPCLALPCLAMLAPFKASLPCTLQAVLCPVRMPEREAVGKVRGHLLCRLYGYPRPCQRAASLGAPRHSPELTVIVKL